MPFPESISWNDFSKIEIRVGTIIHVASFPQARKPAYQLTIDFGKSGIKKSSAQLTSLYKAEDLLHKQIVAVINFPPKQIANFFSQCLVLGVMADNGDVVLLQPERSTTNGLKIG